MTASIADQRRAALAARRGLERSARLRASMRACRRIARTPEFRRARRIGLYWPLASEIDPRPLLERRRHLQTVLLPRVAGDRLVFLAIDTPHFRHRRSPLGVVEPLGGAARSIETLDLLVLPLAGFDARARRIGLGGGFYDRSLARCREAGFRGPRLIGIAFEAQRLDAIEPQPWDVPLDAVVSEARVYRPRASALR